MHRLSLGTIALHYSALSSCVFGLTLNTSTSVTIVAASEALVAYQSLDKLMMYTEFPSLHDAVSLWVANSNEIISTEEPGDFDALSSSFQKDKVIRVVDANTVQLERAGKMQLAGIRTPSAVSFTFPECFRYNPDSKLVQLLPPKSPVWIRQYDSQAVIIRETKDGKRLVVNKALLESGFAKVRTNNLAADTLPTAYLRELEESARSQGRGIFQQCDKLSSSTSEEARFEPIIQTEIQWGIDGGRRVRRVPEGSSTQPPDNPGDRVGCSDFSNYEDALSYFERYRPYFGDVARLDRDNDGIPCPKLPHTSNPDRYRMKKPSTVISADRK